jgi:serine/threonine-protein kinase
MNIDIMPNDFSLSEVQELYPEYEISEYIDSGGTKDVFRGQLDGRDIVVKLLPVESRHRLRRAEREARAMEIIESDIFVDLIEHFIDEIHDEDTIIFVIVEEFVNGRTLEQVIEGGEASQQLGEKVLKNLLEVLQEFDNHDLVHRDIKPSNIMISTSGDVKLLDVGIARFTKKTSLTDTGADYAPGTRGYRAPEQIKNRKQEQDIRTDLFSTGIVFFESITGEHPFDHGQEDLSDAILRGNRKALENHIGESPLVEVYERLTENELHERYRKPEHASQELELLMEGI